MRYSDSDIFRYIEILIRPMQNQKLVKVKTVSPTHLRSFGWRLCQQNLHIYI